MAAARVKGAQGPDYSARDKVVTSVKHYVGYGQPEGGRDYNTTDMSESTLRNLYLPPFKAAIDAGSDTVMCSFNAINGVPGCANRYTETQILKHQWGFDGFIESDYTAVSETRACPPVNPDTGPCGHGTAADGPEAGADALMAGTDSEMVSTNIRDFGAQLLAQHRITMRRLDDAVRRILRVKFRAGLFRHPYVNQAAATDPASFLTPTDRARARAAAGKSMVLLKNDNATLPFDPTKKTVVIGPLGNDQHDMLGPWWGQGKDTDAVTVLDGITAQSPGTTFVQGCTLSNDEPPAYDPANDCPTDAGFAAAVTAAQSADQVVLALGETREMSGEAASRSTLDLPGRQQELIDAIKATGTPFVVVLFNGRPLTLGDVAASSPAILEAWFPGVEAGNAVADVLFGKVDPGGKLPVSFPQRLGQVPIYYNHLPTGRPCDVTQKYVSRYRDLRSCDPLFPFGYGLSYTTFSVSGLSLDRRHVPRTGSVHATVTVTNTGHVAGDDVVQLYLHDPVASISQPVRRLRGFDRVTLAPGESRRVTFTIDRSDFGFYDNRGRFVVEPGQIELYAGDSSQATLKRTFTVTR
jgi:beta-glucosidase